MATASPGPYLDQIRVNALDLESVAGFVKQLLATNDLFPNQPKPLCGYGEAHPKLRDLAVDLHAKLRDTITELRAPDVEERWASTYLCVELDAETSRRAARGRAGRRSPHDRRARLHRRQAGRRPRCSVHSVCRGEKVGDLQIGMAGVPGRARWFDSLVEQIRATVLGLFPIVPWAPFSVETGKAVIPYVAGVRTVPTRGAIQVLVYFVPMSPRPVPVVERMIEPDQMFHKDLVATPGDQILLVDLIAQMKKGGPPHAGADGRRSGSAEVHRAPEPDRRVRVPTGRPRRPRRKTLTVHDLLDDPCRADTYRTTLAVVGPDADMDTTLAAMDAVAGCQDVFVTEDGTADTAVIGWVTNTMFTR